MGDNPSNGGGISILMYHSISSGPGPTNIPTSVFKSHLDVLAELGYRVLSLSEFADWHRGEAELSGRVAVITFDDGFRDFADEAFPILKQRGWSATVFVPTGRLGGLDQWEDSPSRQLMDWSEVRQLSEQGMDFGAHTVTHRDLTKASDDELVQEIVDSKRDLEQKLGRAIDHFAPPYGKANQTVRREVSKHFELSFGTALDRAHRSSDAYDLPRIEMHYFRDAELWRDYLEGNAEGYFAKRKLLRRIRQFMRLD